MHMYFCTEMYMYIVEMLILSKCSVCSCILVRSQFANLELRIIGSSFSIALDFDISRFESSWGHDDVIRVNGWQFSPGKEIFIVLGLLTRQPLWVTLCHLPQKERREIERRNSRGDEREGQGRKRERGK